MRVKLSKHGNSLGFVVPASIVREAALEIGQEYELTLKNSELRFTPRQKKRRSRYTAAELLQDVPVGTLNYDDVPEYVPMGREWPE